MISNSMALSRLSATDTAISYTDSFNDIDTEQVTLYEGPWLPLTGKKIKVDLLAHSVNVIQVR